MHFPIERIGIVGATGFIGKALVTELLDGGRRHPRLFGRSNGQLNGCVVFGLTFQPEEFKGLDVVVHLSGITSGQVDPDILRKANVDFVIDVARTAAAAGVKRFIFISSMHVHGKSASKPVGPDTPFKGDDAYGRSKIAAEKALIEVAREVGLRLTILRPPMVYGPGNKGNFRLLARLISSGLPLPLTQAQGVRSFCSVTNLVGAIRHVLMTDVDGVLIPADAEDYTIVDLIQYMAPTLGQHAKIWPVPRSAVKVALTLIGRRQMISSLFDPLRVDRSHWKQWGWKPIQTGKEGIQQALLPVCKPRALFLTNSTPYFFSHRVHLARKIGGRGFDIALAGGDVEDFRNQIEAEGFRVLPIPGGARGIDPIGDIKAGWAIGGIIRRDRIAVLHATGLKTILLCALARLRTPLPKVVCIVTGLGSTYSSNKIRARVLQLIIETIIRPLLKRSRTSVVFQNSDDYRYFLSRKLVHKFNGVVIRGSGVDTDVFKFVEEPSGIPLVVFPARLLKSKGVLDFAQAAATLHSQGIEARFALTGELDPGNPDSLSLIELSSLIREGHVEAWGFQSNMADIFAKCHLVCLPSYYREGVPKALIEAASAGRAIVTTDLPGCREIVVHDKNGLLVPPRNSDALADAIKALLLDAERRKMMGLAGRVMVERDFSLDVVLESTASLYGTPRDYTN